MPITMEEELDPKLKAYLEKLRQDQTESINKIQEARSKQGFVDSLSNITNAVVNMNTPDKFKSLYRPGDEFDKQVEDEYKKADFNSSISNKVIDYLKAKEQAKAQEAIWQNRKMWDAQISGDKNKTTLEKTGMEVGGREKTTGMNNSTALEVAMMKLIADAERDRNKVEKKKLLPAATAVSLAGLVNADKDLDQLSGNWDVFHAKRTGKTVEKVPLVGGLLGAGSRAVNKAVDATSPEAEYVGQKQHISTKIAKIFEEGKLSDFDKIAFDSGLPDINTLPENKQFLINQTKQSLRNKLLSNLDGLEDAGFDVSKFRKRLEGTDTSIQTTYEADKKKENKNPNVHEVTKPTPEKQDNKTAQGSGTITLIQISNNKPFYLTPELAKKYLEKKDAKGQPLFRKGE